MEKESQTMTSRLNKQEETLKKHVEDCKDYKKNYESTKEEMMKIRETQEAIWDSLAMQELRQNDLTLRVRGLKEYQDENVEITLIKGIAEWMQLKEEDVSICIDRAFRLRSKQARNGSWPGDKIMQHKKQEKPRIEGKEIIIMREVPPRLLRKRSKYKPLTEVLKRNNILFKWEFPEGISFTYKQSRKKLTSEFEIEKFWRKYEKHLGGSVLGKKGDKEESDAEESEKGT
ncbi:uncharacterized protein LOC117055222 [Lacerta agilis]|uniref:uncharacterized protein LOC117055222 n=1 Tax=Lacerta agilis TaxID=80427 RepID=UPI00141A2036|nr:uncharacterized protein LOC117055222 [Lacerta agilis]